MKKPLSITSPNHAVAVSLYAMLGLTGLLGVANINRTSPVYSFMGPVMADVWFTTLMIFGFAAAIAAMGAKKARRPENALTYEMFACAGLVVNMAYFIYIVWTFFPAGLASSTFATVFVFGFTLRAVQIWREQRIIKKARANPSVSDDPLLADPREDDRLL